MVTLAKHRTGEALSNIKEFQSFRNSFKNSEKRTLTNTFYELKINLFQYQT